MNLAACKAQFPEMFFSPTEATVEVNGESVHGKKAILNGERVLSIVSSKYKPISNDSIAERFVEIADAAGIEYQFKNATSYRNGTYSAFTIEFPTKQILTGKNDSDVSILRASLNNDFSGVAAASMSMGMWRQTCSNGAGVYERQSTELFKHVGAVEDKIVEGFKDYLEVSFNIAKRYVDDLTELSFPDRETVLTAIATSEFLGKRKQEAVEAEWKSGEFAESLNGWGLFNAYTKIITHNIRSVEQREYAQKQMYKLSKNWLAGKFVPETKLIEN